MEDNLVAILVPLGFFGSIISIVFAIVWARVASRRTGAEVLKAAIQNGQVLTADVINALGRPVHTAEHDLRSGIILGCLSIGFAVCGFVIRMGAVFAIGETGAVERFSENSGGPFFIIAIILGALAIGQLLSAFLRRGKKDV